MKIFESERIFYNALENTMNNKIIEYLVIGNPNDKIIWYFVLRVAEIIKSFYWNNYEKEVNISFSLSERDFFNKIDEMKPNDIHILELNNSYGKNIVSYIESLENEQKNFIYISNEDNPQINDLIGYIIYCWKDIQRINSKIMCKICDKNSTLELYFSYPHRDLIQRFERYIKNI